MDARHFKIFCIIGFAYFILASSVQGRNHCEAAKGCQSNLQRFKRQDINDPKAHLDQEIQYLLATLPDLIDEAIEITEAAQRFKVFKRVTQGWSIVFASWGDVYSDYVTYNRSLGNLGGMKTIYKYGFLGFNGVGFGSPLLLGLPDDTLTCGSKDFLRLLDRYHLTNGLDSLFASGLPTAAISSIVGEFDLLVRVEIECILDFEGEETAAEEVLFALDELDAALNLRIDIKLEEEQAQAEAEGENNQTFIASRRYSTVGRHIPRKTFLQKAAKKYKSQRISKRFGYHPSELQTRVTL